MPAPPPSSTTGPGPSRAGGLHVAAIGRGRPIVMAHGFTQTGRVWGSLEARLAVDHRVLLVDMPGHGRSAAVRATLVEGAGLLADAGGRAAYLGYSMGARFCLHLALARPGLVDRLVLISGTAGLEDPGERRARRESDEAMAELLDPVDHRSPAPVPVASFLHRWLENPLFDGISPAANGLEERLHNTGPGLASSLRQVGTGTQRPLWGSLGRLAMPVLIITGEKDTKYSTLGERMARAIGPNAVHTVVTGTGHAPHLQRPETVATLVRDHLAGPDRD